MFERHKESRWRAPDAPDERHDDLEDDDDEDDAAFAALMRQAVATSAHATGRCAGTDLRTIAPGTLLGERYEVSRLLGAGGMGVVFAARDRKMGGKPVAIKWLRIEPSHASVTRRFMREALAAGPIVHPHVVSIFDLGFYEDRPYLVLELLEGEPLSARLARGRFDVAETLAIAGGILRGVAAAHARGIIHRDLKPGNVFLCTAGDGVPPAPKVLDFGIAKLSPETFGRLTLTDPDMLLGTPHDMAPEMIRGEAVDVRTDLYSVSVLLYAMLTGRMPFDAPSEYELYRRILQGERVPLRSIRSDVPHALANVIERGMAVERQRRYASADVMLGALEGSVRRVKLRVVGGGLALATACALLLGALVALSWLLTTREPPLPRLPTLPRVESRGATP